jgi:hypothetical protein
MIIYTIPQLETECQVYDHPGKAFIIYEKMIISGELKIIDLQSMGHLRKIIEWNVKKTIKLVPSAIPGFSACRNCGTMKADAELVGDLRLCVVCL